MTIGLEKGVIMKHLTYNNIVSFGCMCSLALYLRKTGLRSSSCFFDWITSNLKNNIELVECNFKDFFNEQYFKQEFDGYPHLITNTKYNFVYTHVFNPKETFEKQRNSVKKNVQKKINNFERSISDKCLLIYYSRSIDENNWIKENQNLISSFADKYNCDFLFVLNFDITGEFIFPKFVIPQNNIHKPNGGGVSYPFVDTDDLTAYLISHYDEKKRKKNLKYKLSDPFLLRLKRRLERSKKDKLVINHE